MTGELDPIQTIEYVNNLLTGRRSKDYINEELSRVFDDLLDEGSMIGEMPYLQDNSVGYFLESPLEHNTHLRVPQNPIGREFSVLSPFIKNLRHPIGGIFLEKGNKGDLVVYNVAPPVIDAVYAVSMKRTLVRSTGGIALQFSGSRS